MPPILVAGAGPGGLTTALALTRRGHDVLVLEAADALRPGGAGLTLQVNAMRALAPLGVADELAARGAPLTGGAVATASGRVLRRLGLDDARERYGQPGVGVLRPVLSEVLASRLPPGALRFGARVTAVHPHEDGVEVELERGGRVRGAALVGADGIHSAVRTCLMGPLPPRYAGYTCWRGVAPTSAWDAQASERLGVGRRFGFVGVGDGQTYWFATANAPAGGADGPDPRAELLVRFQDFADPVLPLIRATPEARIQRNDIIDLPPLPRWTWGLVTLLGDAAHAMTPNMGQGACQAIEDGAVLAACLADRPGDPAAALAAYERIRRTRTARFQARSSFIGRVGQWEGRLACRLRDAAIAAVPEAVARRALDEVWGVEVPA